MKLKKWICLLLALLLAAALLPLPAVRAHAAEQILTFSDGGVAATLPGSGCTVSGTTLTVTASGTYRITGSCADGSIVVAKGLQNVTLILDDLSLSCSYSAPLVVKKESSVLLRLEGESTLTDTEDAATEDTNADFEGACVKVKSGSSLTICGDGTLNAVGAAKNGLKGAALSTLTVDGGTVNARAANNAVAFDGSVTVNAGRLFLTADGDGLKSEPDETDTASPGTVTIRGGELCIRAGGDGIQAASALSISGGSFDVQTLDGWQSSGFDSDTMSCKGLKVSGDAETCRLTVTGGSFLLNTADDAVHSDGAVDITGGTFEIYTGDDGVHAETALTLGSEGGYERDPEITVRASYEGLEGSTVEAWSGKYWIVASDDGINAAGGSSNGSDPFGPGGGWGGHGGPGGGPGGGGPGGGPGGGGPGGGGSASYYMNFHGGDFYIDCRGDGIDANGAINLLGGTFTVLSMAANGDNSPLDADGTMQIKGATVFGAGSAGMSGRPASGSQAYYIDSTRRNAGTVVNVSLNGSVVYSETLLRSISYLLYSAPGMTASGCTVGTAGAVSPCRSNAWAHEWDGGEAQDGVIVYTCAACGKTERKTAASATGECEHAYAAAVTAPTCTEPGYTTYTCAKCGDSYVGDEVAALGHDWDAGVVTVPATETSTGIRTYTCARCGEKRTEVIPELVHVHDYKAVVTVPTCTEKGYTTYTCAGCGDSYVADETAALGHSFGAWSVRKAATCTEKGGEVRTCARCGEEETRETAALGHDYKAVVTAPTCTAAGFTTHTCTRCGSSYTDGATAALGHAWDAGAVTKQPTETSTGIRTYTCTRCGETRTEVIPELSHVHSYTAQTVAPTCTEGGYTLHTCTCGDSYRDGYTDALGHSFGAWSVSKAAACTEKGEETRTCARCGEKETREIEALGHDYRAVVTAPTCTEDGFTTYTCSRCNDSYRAEETAALGHDFGEWAVSRAATCTAEGEETRSCVRCDEKQTRAIEKAAHDFKDGRCTVCGETDPNYVNYDALNAAIEAAEQLDLSKYTEETAAAFNKALEAAKTALAADQQAAVDKAKADLEAAVKALVEKSDPFRFDDVRDESMYYFTPVYWAYEHDPQITTGTSANLFSPDRGCTRAQVVTFLWRAKGEPEPERTSNPFADVRTGAYYYKAVLWAVENGVTTGTSAATFRPDQTCTRAQIVTFLWRAEGQPEPESSKNPFADVKSGEYYTKAVLWAVENEITKGTSADKN